MKIEKLEEDEFFWRTIFKYRKSMDDFIIERKSSKHPESNHEIWLSNKDAKSFVEFVKKAIKL